MMGSAYVKLTGAMIDFKNKLGTDVSFKQNALIYIGVCVRVCMYAWLSGNIYVCVCVCVNKSICLYNSIGLLSTVFASGPADQGAIPDRVIPKNGTWCRLA